MFVSASVDESNVNEPLKLYVVVPKTAVTSDKTKFIGVARAMPENDNRAAPAATTAAAQQLNAVDKRPLARRAGSAISLSAQTISPP
jgi:hypothetical protein